MSVFCITQARLGSSRFPNKVLMPTEGIALLDYHMRRVQQSCLVDTHIVAIPDTQQDQKLESFCRGQGYSVFKGDELNVLSRFYQAAVAFGAQADDTIIRLTGDCPLICPQLIDEVVSSHLQKNAKGYSHLSLGYWARGLDIEVFSMATLQQTYMKASLPMEIEHVTYYIYTHPEQFTIMPIEGGNSRWAEYRLCVDESADFVLFETIVKALGDKWPTASGQYICELLDAKPHWIDINRDVAQKKPQGENAKQETDKMARTKSA